jgi:hypothetical protein
MRRRTHRQSHDQSNIGGTARAASGESSPTPLNRIVTRRMVRVRANHHLAEPVNGLLTRFAPGDTFTTDADRAAALGRLVTVL